MVQHLIFQWATARTAVSSVKHVLAATSTSLVKYHIFPPINSIVMHFFLKRYLPAGTKKKHEHSDNENHYSKKKEFTTVLKFFSFFFFLSNSSMNYSSAASK